MTAPAPYEPDLGPLGKARRQLTRLHARRPAPRRPTGGGLITFSFDDAPLSSVEAAAPVLEARRARGTWYLCAGLFDADVPHLGGLMAGGDAAAELHARGHEVACHTWGHLDCGRTAAADVVADVERNGAALSALGAPPRTFAYPFGDVSFGAKRALGRRFALCRGVRPGLVRRGSDLAQAPAVGLQGPEGEAEALCWTARAAAEGAAAGGAWLILFTHDVRPGAGAWGCTPDALARTVDAALAAGLEPVTAAEGARRMGAAA